MINLSQHCSGVLWSDYPSSDNQTLIETLVESLEVVVVEVVVVDIIVGQGAGCLAVTVMTQTAGRQWVACWLWLRAETTNNKTFGGNCLVLPVRPAQASQ